MKLTILCIDRCLSVMLVAHLSIFSMTLTDSLAKCL